MNDFENEFEPDLLLSDVYQDEDEIETHEQEPPKSSLIETVSAYASDALEAADKAQEQALNATTAADEIKVTINSFKEAIKALQLAAEKVGKTNNLTAKQISQAALIAVKHALNEHTDTALSTNKLLLSIVSASMIGGAVGAGITYLIASI